MTTQTLERFRAVAAAFSEAIDAVPENAWGNPSPCAGWSARDVVGHLVEWIPGPGFLLGTFGVETGPIPSVDDDPGGAWAVVRAAIEAGLDDPAVADRVEDCGPAGQLSFAAAVEMTCISDVYIHTWDLAQATGIDAALDAAETARQLGSIASIPPHLDEAMRASGHFGPRVEVGDDAAPVTRVLAFYGRRAST